MCPARAERIIDSPSSPLKGQQRIEAMTQFKSVNPSTPRELSADEIAHVSGGEGGMLGSGMGKVGGTIGPGGGKEGGLIWSGGG